MKKYAIIIGLVAFAGAIWYFKFKKPSEIVIPKITGEGIKNTQVPIVPFTSASTIRNASEVGKAVLNGTATPAEQLSVVQASKAVANNTATPEQRELIAASKGLAT